MQAKENVKKIIISVIDVIIVTSLLLSFVFMFVNSKEKEDVFDVSDGWTVIIDGEEFDDVNLNAFQFPKGIGQDVKDVVMVRTLDRDMCAGTTLRVYSRLAFIQVDMDGEVLYYAGKEGGKPNMFVGMGYHFIQIPMNFSLAERELTIHLVSQESGGINGLPDVALTSSEVAYPYFVDENAIGMFASVFIFMLGLVLTIISILYTHLNQDYFRLFLIGSFALCVGLWCMCSQKILLLFNVSLSANSSMEFYLMEMAFLPLLGYDIKVREGMYENEKLTIRILIIINMVYNFIAATLHFTNTLHYPQFVMAFYVLALVDCVAMMYVGVRPVKTMTISEKVFHYSMAAMAVFGFWKIIDYVYGNYLVRGEAREAEISMPLALLFFVGLLVISYLSHLYDMVLSQAQEEALTTLAYKDTLTGLYNRAKSEELFKHLNEEQHPNYVFLNFDLNGLKVINDKEGHARGDLLISSFGRILQEAFSSLGKNMRMGGDEFLTIIEGDNLPDQDELITLYEEKVKEVSQEVELDISASYGVAYSSEVFEPEAEQIFRLADERMYEMKELSKRAKGLQS